MPTACSTRPTPAPPLEFRLALPDTTEQCLIVSAPVSPHLDPSLSFSFFVACYCRRPPASPQLRHPGNLLHKTQTASPLSILELRLQWAKPLSNPATWPTAETAFRRVLSVDPQSGAAYANLGVIAMRRKEWDHALSLLQKAEKLEPKMSGIRLNIGLVNYRRGDYAAAIAPLSSVVRDQPDSQQPRYLLGLCQVFTEHYADAVSTLEPLWPQLSNDVTYLYVLDIAAHGSGKSDLDEKALYRLVEIGGQSPEFHLILGKAYLNREEPDKAISELELAAVRKFLVALRAL